MTAPAVTQVITSVVPSGLTALPVSPTEIDLSWTDTPNETGFRLERSTDGIAFTPLMTLAAGVTTYADTSVSGSVVYYYRVVGLYGTTESAASSVVENVPRFNRRGNAYDEFWRRIRYRLRVSIFPGRMLPARAGFASSARSTA